MHIPVLLNEVISHLKLYPNAHCIDGTLGLGGHTRAILERTGPEGKVIGFDRDRTALLLATEDLREFGDRFVGIHDSYANVLEHQATLDTVGPIHGILLDLGLSSMQLDRAERGFSFRFSGPLDMRFDQTHGATAADLLNSYSEAELKQLFKEFGEEPQSGRIARAIVERRKEQPFHFIEDIVDLITRLIPVRPHRIHPATRIFQALRIAVNHELEQLQRFLPVALDLLAPGGRMAVISFHSLEDRMVKQFFQQHSLDCICPPEIPECRCEHFATLKKITKKPLFPTEEEIQQNPRARSAKLRVIEKI